MDMQLALQLCFLDLFSLWFEDGLIHVIKLIKIRSLFRIVSNIDFLAFSSVFKNLIRFTEFLIECLSSSDWFLCHCDHLIRLTLTSITLGRIHLEDIGLGDTLNLTVNVHFLGNMIYTL